MPVRQCFICREFSWDVCVAWGLTDLCLPCYVDVLEVREHRGAMPGPDAEVLVLGGGKAERSEQEPRGRPGKPVPPSDPRQIEMFDA